MSERSLKFRLGDSGLIAILVLATLFLCLNVPFGTDARDAVAGFGVPFSPTYLLLSVLMIWLLADTVWRSRSWLKVGEGWVEIPRLIGSRRLTLQGACIRFITPFRLPILTDREGKSALLHLPSRHSDKGTARILSLHALREQGLDWRETELRPVETDDLTCQGKDFNNPGWNRVNAAAAPLFLPIGATFLNNPPLAWLIFVISTGLGCALIFWPLGVMRFVPSNGVLLKDGVLTVRHWGKDLWSAPLADLRLSASELWRDQEPMVRAWSGQNELRIPSSEGQESRYGEDLVWTLIGLGVPLSLAEDLRRPEE